MNKQYNLDELFNSASWLREDERKFTRESLEWIIENNDKYPVKELHRLYCLKFYKVTIGTLRSYRKKLGLLNNYRLYSEEELNFIKPLIDSDVPYANISEMFNAKFNANTNESSMAVLGRMKFGKKINYKHTCPNPHSSKAIGQEVVRNNVLYVKTSNIGKKNGKRATAENWERKDAVTLGLSKEQAKKTIIVHLDGDIYNCDKDNLVAVNRRTIAKVIANGFRDITSPQLLKCAIAWAELENQLTEQP